MRLSAQYNCLISLIQDHIVNALWILSGLSRRNIWLLQNYDILGIGNYRGEYFSRFRAREDGQLRRSHAEPHASEGSVEMHGCLHQHKHVSWAATVGLLLPFQSVTSLSCPCLTEYATTEFSAKNRNYTYLPAATAALQINGVIRFSQAFTISAFITPRQVHYPAKPELISKSPSEAITKIAVLYFSSTASSRHYPLISVSK